MGVGQSTPTAAALPQCAAAFDPVKAQAYAELRAKLALRLGMQMWAQLEAEVEACAMQLLAMPQLPPSPYADVRLAAVAPPAAFMLCPVLHAPMQKTHGIKTIAGSSELHPPASWRTPLN